MRRGAHRHAKRLFSLVVFALAGLLAGCGGSSDNGVSSKSGSEILAASRKAASGASSVHIVGHNAQGPARLDVDLQSARQGSQARIKLLGTGLELIRVGDTLYLKGSPSAYARLGIQQNVPAGAWVAIPATGKASELTSFTDLQKEPTNLIAANGTVTKGSTTTIDGEKAIELRTQGKLYSARLFVKTDGQPYPLRLEKQGRESGLTTFQGWDQTAAAKPPSNVVKVEG